MRRRVEGNDQVFDDYVWDGFKWSPGSPIPDDPGNPSSGVVLLNDGTRIAAFAIRSDTANSVRYTLRTNGTWSPWGTLVGSVATRAWLSGTGCEETAHPALLWTESDGQTLSLVGTANPF